MQELRPPTIEDVLQQSLIHCPLLTGEERRGGWRLAFGEVADRVPRPYWLFADDEQTPFTLGFPLKVSTSWDTFCRELGQLIEAEASYRCSVALGERINKTDLMEQRAAFGKRLAGMFENALLHDHGRRLAELLWLAHTREIAERLSVALRSVLARASQLPGPTLAEIRYAVARRIIDGSSRAEAEAVGRLRRMGALDVEAGTLAFTKLLRSDILPFAEQHVGGQLKDLDSYFQGYLKLDAQRFHSLIASTVSQIDRLRQRDASFDRVLSLLDREAPALPAEKLLLSRAALNLLEVWSHPMTPRLSTEMLGLLRDLGELLRRFQVVVCLRRRIFPLGLRGSRPVTRVQGQFVRLSPFTRPVDFTAPGIVDVSVRRYGLLYDLVEFTQLLEELRRRGKSAEDHASRSMIRFQREVDSILGRYRLRFEKFLGDGAFFSARSARALLRAAADLRVLYQRLCHQGFPFDRGLRLALNVGTYHLLPLVAGDRDEPHFEFFGHGVVELARLTTGKTTHEVDDIADFLMAAGYDVHRVLEFLEPVRQSPRFPDNVKERPYAAFLAENGELVNLGGVVTEGFLQDLEGELEGHPIAEGERFGLRWVLLPCDSARLEGPWIGLRPLGTARLKGLQPTSLAEMVVFEQAPEGTTPHPEGTLLCRTLRRLAGSDDDTPEQALAASEGDVDAALCVVSVLESAVERAWYIGLYEEEFDALLSAFRVPLNPDDLRDGEPFEAWLFRQRGELARLYHGLRRDSNGAAVPLENLRFREGYFTCLLAAPHRSPR